MTIDEYIGLDACALASLVARGQVTPAELVETAIERLTTMEPVVNGMTEWLLDRARREAMDPPAGAFRGTPFLLKDNLHVAAGVPYHNGSRIWRGWTPPADSEFMKRLRAAGMIMLGSTRTSELSFAPVTESKIAGPVRNPWNLDRTAGGSSGGSGAHVAARSVPVAHGVDGGGSIRIPASCCGLFGLKPTRGRTPNGPFAGEPWHGAAIGHVLTRTVGDSAALLDVLAGSDQGAPYAAPAQHGSFFQATLRRPGSLRVAFTAAAPNGVAVDVECQNAVLGAANLCADLGHRVEQRAPPIPAGYFEWFTTIVLASVAQEFRFAEETTGTKARRRDVENSVWLARAFGEAMSAVDLSLALERIHRASRMIAAFFEEFDLLLTPTLARAPLHHGELDPKGIESLLQTVLAFSGGVRVLRPASLLEEAAARAFSFTPFTPVWNMSGQPAASLPLHWSSDGMPIGVQAIGRFGAEATLLSFAAQLEEARPWITRSPGERNCIAAAL
ncbi:MAG: amidase family protein [Beijerinckiaceae bacterium]|nr:amidase family protein [Beijerinckiaceae bacterium]